MVSNAVQANFDPARQQLSEAIFESARTLMQDPNSELGLNANDIATAIEMPPDRSLGDFAFPCFKLAKALKMPPPVVAQKIASKLEEIHHPWISRIEIKNAFLNVFVNPVKMADFTINGVLNGSFFDLIKGSKVNQSTNTMIEFSQPNTHKEFHVGHLRNVCLGDSLVRIFRFNGYPVVPVNYIGDEGAHVAKCIWQMNRYKGPGPRDNKIEWYNQRYAEATTIIGEANEEEKKVYLNEVSLVLRDIETQTGKNFELWKTTRQDCLDSFNDIYRWLDVKFEHFFYESEVSTECQEIVDQCIASGLFTESDGAYGVDLKEYKLGYFLARKSDGNSLYITKDLALAKKKFKDYKIEKSIYVVGDEQSFHFRQLFKVLELMGFSQAKNCYHLAYGMVVSPEGKMSSRKGNSFTFIQLKELIVAEINKYLAKYEGLWSADQIKETSERLTLGAIKYGMLSMDPNREIVFDPKLWVSFEGDSGPYLMYAYARTRSILAKADAEGYKPATLGIESLTSDSERALIRSIYDFNEVVVSSARNCRPSTLANHLFEMCKNFNRFYADTPILKAGDKSTIEVRLAVVAVFGLTLKEGLNLLGITPVEKM
jgi:arginyl-tRNA synthetase